MKFSVVILAGGASRRMGRDKSGIAFQGSTLIARQVALARELQPVEVFVSGRPGIDYSSLGCPVLFDQEPDCGPLSGIERALAMANSPLVLVLPVDLPCLTSEFLRQLTSACTEQVGVVPECNGQLEPLVAVYPRNAHALVRQLLGDRRRAAREFALACLERGLVVKRFTAPTDAERFVNWNHPHDVAAKND